MALIRRNQKHWPLLLLVVLCAPATMYAQASQPAVALHVAGDVLIHLDLSINDLAAFPRRTIHVMDEKHTPAQYTGVPVAEILQKASAPFGSQLKGPNMAVGLVARAPDGYHVLFSIAEFDLAFSDRVILLADHRDGKPLDNHEGPLRFIVPGDKRHARWIRGVTTLDVVKVR